MQLHATTELTNLRSPPPVFLVALIPPPLFFPKSRAPPSISWPGPSWSDSARGEHPQILLNLPQAAPFPLHATSELPTSSHGRGRSCSGRATFDPFSYDRSHLNGIPFPSSFFPCPWIWDWWPESPYGEAPESFGVSHGGRAGEHEPLLCSSVRVSLPPFSVVISSTSPTKNHQPTY